MKFKLAAVLLVAALLLSGCASLQTTKDILEVTITPDTGVNAGTTLISTVKTSQDVAKVYAYLTIKQEYKLQYTFNTKKDCWQAALMIPPFQPLPRGEFTVRIEVIKKNGEKQAVERKIRTY